MEKEVISRYKKMKKQTVGLLIVIAIILVVTSIFVIYNQWPLLVGNTVVLDTRPVDPFDPFRGQYMVIDYGISRFNNSGFLEGDTVYVALEEDEGIWIFKEASKTKPQGIFIKGKIENVYGNTARAKYGIEQFFFERHAELPTTNITVEVKITGSGRAALVQLLYNGEPIEIKYEKFDIKS